MSKNDSNLRIMLVEDHPTTRCALEIWLTDLGHEVTAVVSASQALDAAAGQTFDVLVSDINLPDGDGRELVKRLRQTHEFRAIAISGLMLGPGERRASHDAGFIAHLEKPFNPMDLEEALRAVA